MADCEHCLEVSHISFSLLMGESNHVGMAGDVIYIGVSQQTDLVISCRLLLLDDCTVGLLSFSILL